MAKFNISTVKPGQLTEADKSVVETPVERKVEETPQANAFEALLAGEPTDVDAAAQEITTEADKDPDIEAQREAERVVPLKERIDAAKESSPKWELSEPVNETDAKASMNNLIDRAANMKAMLDEGKISAGWGLGINTRSLEGEQISKIAKTQGSEAAASAIQTVKPYSTGSVLTKIGALQYSPDTAKSLLHPKFGGTLSVVTENYFNTAQDATPAGVPKETQDPFTGEPSGELVRPESDYLIEKAKGNDKLGQAINQEFQRTRNQELGRPTDEYENLSYEEATVLGDMAKELFYRANPDLIKRSMGTDGKTYFRMTATGEPVFRASREARKRLFPTENIRPSATVLPQGKLVGEGRKLKRDETKKAGDLGKLNLINKAKQNLHSVPNVVDPQRLKILLSTALPAIIAANRLNTDTRWSNIAGIGSKQRQKFEAAAKLTAVKEERRRQALEKQGEDYFPAQPYNVEANIKLMSNNLAQNIRAIAMEKGKANHLTYATQPFTGRIFPQQTYFDPTSSKLVRFATRNATPSVAKPGNRVMKNLEQMYAMMFIKEASEALPHERVRLLNVEGPKLYEMGKKIKAAMDEQISDEQIQVLADAIANNVPPSDPNFPQVPELQLPEDIMVYLNKKGSDDALSVLDGLVDYVGFVDAMKAKRPYESFFNAYMDGKTNGLANNGIQLGNEKMAAATGVIRTNNMGRLLDGDKDLRDQLGDIIHDKMKDDGFEGMDSLDNPVAVQNIITTVGRMRPLQKGTTMEYGYGKDLANLKGNIEEAIGEAIATDPNLDEISDALPANKKFSEVYNRALEQFDGNPDKLLQTIHKEYSQGITTLMSKESAEARALMRANATMYSLMDEIFSIVGPAGFNLNMAGTQILNADEEKAITYNLTKAKTDDPTKATAYFYGKKDTAAAERRGTPGLYAYGRSLTTPVQALDASTVAQTVTGKSWDRLKQASGGNPYVHTIYDAFKVDANGYDVVLEEVNKNWLNTSFDWSYLEQTRDSYKRDWSKFRSELNKLPGDQVLNKKEHHGVNMMEWLLDTNPVSGKINLINRIVKSTYKGNETEKDARTRAGKSVERAMQILTKMGYKHGTGEATVEQYKWFVDFMHHQVYDLNDRNTRFTNTINAKKKDLRKRINPKTVYQYYSH